jgi:hypothetical protein
MKFRYVLVCCISLIVLFMVIAMMNIYYLTPVEYASVENNQQMYSYSGAIHVHSVQSDGSGTKKSIAAEAKRAGLDYVVVTDHSVGPEARLDAAYYDSVLVMAGCEVSLPDGHFLYIPHPDSMFLEYNAAMRKRLFELDNEAIVVGAHPYSKRRPLSDLAFQKLDAFEMVNADMVWRDVPLWNLAQAIVMYPFTNFSINLLYQYPHNTMRVWKKLQKQYDKNYSIFASVDAHAYIKISDSWHLEFPAYETVFSMFQTTILSKEPFSGDFIHDSRLVYEALKNGRSYIGFGNLGNPKGFSFIAQKKDQTYYPGDTVSRTGFGDDDAITLRVNVPAQGKRRIYLKTQYDTVLVHDTSNLEYKTASKGKYFVEVYQLRPEFGTGRYQEVPWIISNAIDVR